MALEKSPTKSYGMDITGKKIQPSALNFSPVLFQGFPHPHQSPPSYLDRANRRNLALQLHMPCISLLRFQIFLRMWKLVRFFPMIMRSVAHNQQTFCPTVLTRLRMDECQRMLIDMLMRHHSANSALVSNLRFFMWAKR